MKNKVVIALLSLFVISTIFGLFVLVGISNKTTEPDEPKVKDDKIYYKQGDVQKIYEDKNFLATSYNDYKNIVSLYGANDLLTEDDFKDNNYLILLLNIDECREKITDIKSLDNNNGDIKITFNIDIKCGYCAKSTKVFYIRVDKNLNTYNKVEFDYNYTKNKKCNPLVVDKPVIYLYPEKDMNVNVKLSNPKSLSVTYPKYNNGWDVYAKTNGDLIDKNGKKYYALYWESLSYDVDNNIKDGFVIKGEDTIKFLEEKLKVLGLNDYESNEFIMYWLPQLEHNKYNYIRFATMEEINNIMELNITPKADSIIRVLMLFKPLDSEINVNEQILDTPIRKGFTVVEWGGVKLN